MRQATRLPIDYARIHGVYTTGIFRAAKRQRETERRTGNRNGNQKRKKQYVKVRIWPSYFFLSTPPTTKTAKLFSSMAGRDLERSGVDFEGGANLAVGR